MNILVINGTPDNGWVEYEKEMTKTFDGLSTEHNISVFKIRDMKINYCKGCFGCWVKTPGKCFYRDGMDEILSEYPKTDMLLFISPLKAGFLTSETKKVMDRMIPTVLPYINVFNNECHHPKRYDNEPILGLLVFEKGAEIGSFGINSATIDRLALNFHACRTFKHTVLPETIKEVLNNEINCN
jgi:hypothetical protein